MKNMKKLLCAVLTVVMMVSLMSAALAAGTFSDVPEESPYAEYIEDLYDRGIVNGISPTEFGYGMTLNRAQFVTFIGRLAKVDTSKYTDCPFDDVEEIDRIAPWAKPYITWAYELGIAQGKSSTGLVFAAKDDLNRAEMATFMLRFADAYKVSLDLSQIAATDQEKIATNWSWAAKAVRIFGGTSIDLEDDGSFNATGKATREQMAKVISMFPVPEGGFVLPEDNPPTVTGNTVKINGVDYELKAGGKDSMTLVDNGGFSHEYSGKLFTKIFTDAIADDAVVTVKCADGYPVDAITTGAQLKTAMFVFKVDGAEVNDENDGVGYIFRLTSPDMKNAAKYVTEITITGTEAPVPAGNVIKINGVDTEIRPSDKTTMVLTNEKGKDIEYKGKNFVRVYTDTIADDAVVTITCADGQKSVINGGQLKVAMFAFYKDGDEIADVLDGVTYSMRFAYPAADGSFTGKADKYIVAIDF
ncbi:MAG: S-layer homology domain-containing protein [Oscillospiraceae bacterium]|nr:S-layer homology domain-containing protein [Oscillospiraceae bacterium]